MHSSLLHSLTVVTGSTWRWVDGTLGVKKMEDILAAHFFWPKMRRDMVRFVACCTTCQKAKS
jgi:hypothetical protein